MVDNIANHITKLNNSIQVSSQQYFSYIVAVSFIGGGNQSTRRKPPTCRKSLDWLGIGTKIYRIVTYILYLPYRLQIQITKGATRRHTF
jgi:hypothetical protein